MDTFIYRITHYKNLDYILKNGIHCCNANKNSPQHVTIGDTSLISSRGFKPVPLSPGGVLNDYVPFYFWYHSPMLYRIHTGTVAGVSCLQSEIIYIVSSVEVMEKNKIAYVFSDGHAYAGFSSFYNKKDDLKKLDFNVIRDKNWADNSSDNDRMRRKQAEFLAYKFVPITCILGVGVFNDAFLGEVQKILTVNSSSIPAKIYREWYY